MRAVLRCATAILVTALALSGCSGGGKDESAAPKLLGDADLDGLLLSADEMNTLMGTTGMTPRQTVRTMGDHRNLLPNLNCLGVWQVNEAAIYGEGWTAMRQQLQRSPNNDNWDNLVVQSVVSYPSEQQARDFYRQSADRWAKCSDHNVNINLNGQQLPKWRSGPLTETDTQLTMPFTRGTGEQLRSCQRVLAVEANVIIDAQACKPANSTVTQAAQVADEVKALIRG
ncbi:sensor domain-containing protein [Mycolicibacterium neworleansense]|uniref:Putative lipoprotein LppH n=2 Tax=Mycolicibacterium neworleansense TaxID=146018 RepID=A0A0H5RGW5_9MYCO|nr:sensor domain-containing protein [Mycolicibacterium neworleansense]CRZ13395.1 putative lipoprotein LppH [Mycolicibacterium neworleansense]